MPRAIFFSLAVLLTIVPATAQLTPETAVSTPVYGAAPGDQFGPVVATNGSEFLVAWLDWRSGSGAIYANRVSRDRRVLDGTGIRVSLEPAGWNGRLLGAFFIDGAYTLIYSYQLFDPTSFHVAAARISSDGRLVDGPRTVFDGGFVRAAAANGSRIVLVAEDEIVSLDSRGELVARQAIQSAYGVNIASNGTTFLVGTLAYNGVNSVNLIALDANGKLTDVTTIAASASGDGPVMASDGTDYLVIYNDARRGVPIAQVVGAHAEVRSAAITGNYSALLWTGQSYLATSATFPDQQIAVTRLDRTSKPLGAIQILGAGTPGVVNQPSMAWNGTEALLAWNSGSQQTVDSFEVVGAMANRDGDLTSPIMTIPSSSNAQVAPVIATTGSQDLVAWAEGGGIYAARLTTTGIPLDGRGIAVAQQTPAGPFGYFQTLRVIYDGSAYLIAWSDSHGLKAQRIDPRTGSLVGSAIDLAGCTRSFDLVAGPESPMLFIVPCSDGHVFAQRLGLSGPIGAAVQISPNDMLADQPRAAWNGSQWLVTWMKLIELPLLISPPMYRGNVYAARMSRDLTVLDTQPLPIAVSDFDERSPLVASDGHEFVIAWLHGSWNQQSGVYVRRIQNDGSAGDATPVALGPAAATSFVWTGRSYALAFTRNGDLFLTHLMEDELPVSATRTDERYGSLLAVPGRPLRVVYTRVAPEPEYGGVSRVFMRDEMMMRRRSVRVR